MHLRHRWETFETVGRVITQYCTVPGCGKTRIRIRAH